MRAVFAVGAYTNNAIMGDVVQGKSNYEYDVEYPPNHSQLWPLDTARTGALLW